MRTLRIRGLAVLPILAGVRASRRRDCAAGASAKRRMKFDFKQLIGRRKAAER